MNNSKPRTDDIDELLPWFVNGALDAAERARVLEHLPGCANCRNAVEELQRMASVIGNDEATPLIPEPPVAEFMRRLDDRESHRPAVYRPQWLAAAALVLMLAAAVFLAVQPSNTNTFHTVTDAPGEGLVSYVFSVAVPESDAVDVKAALADVNNQVRVARSETGYQVIVSMPSATMTELETVADTLREIDGVVRVDIVGVQLPID